MSMYTRVVLFTGILFNVEASKILAYYPTASISHQVVFRPITLELLKHGHEVTVISTDPMFPEGNGPANLTEIDVHDVSYELIGKMFTSTVTGKEPDLVDQASVDGFKKLLQKRTENFDLILLEAMCAPALGLIHIFRARILISSLGPFPGNFESVGAPTIPTVYHNYFRKRLYNLSPWERLTELIDQIKIIYTLTKNDEEENKMMQRVFGDDVPPLSILKNNVDMLLLNINPIWEGNYPVPPNVIHMGGLHQRPSKELPKDLQNYLDTSINGVVYFSFGTNVKPSLLPADKIVIFENVFAKLPYNVIWKWDDKIYQAKSKNVKLFKWLPQSDLLRHPNVKVFITQGGLQSTDEAITAGVPLIGIPMLIDQWYNVEKYVHHKIGLRLDFDKLNEQKLMNAIIEVVENESYRKNVVHLRSLMQDEPQTNLERSIWWIEYVLRHKGAKHLRAPTANMSWTEYLELELVGVVLMGIVLLYFLLL